MVTEFGMSDSIGPIHYGADDSENVFLGKDFSSRRRDYSENMANQIDDEVRRFVIEGARDQAHTLLEGHREVLDKFEMGGALERETLDAEEVDLGSSSDASSSVRERVVIPTYSADRDKAAKDKRRAERGIFGAPKPGAEHLIVEPGTGGFPVFASLREAMGDGARFPFVGSIATEPERGFNVSAASVTADVARSYAPPDMRRLSARSSFALLVLAMPLEVSAGRRRRDFPPFGGDLLEIAGVDRTRRLQRFDRSSKCERAESVERSAHRVFPG